MAGTSAVTTLSRQGFDAQGHDTVLHSVDAVVTPAGSQRLGGWGEGMRRRRAHFGQRQRTIAGTRVVAQTLRTGQHAAQT
jgi:hypothetical protein